jgi:hypothetical protein
LPALLVSIAAARYGGPALLSLKVGLQPLASISAQGQQQTSHRETR